jgi:hypothetical protein
LSGDTRVDSAEASGSGVFVEVGNGVSDAVGVAFGLGVKEGKGVNEAVANEFSVTVSGKPVDSEVEHDVNKKIDKLNRNRHKYLI